MHSQPHPSKRQDSMADSLYSDMAGGLRFTHNQATANTRKLLEVTSFAYAAIDLLAEKGLLCIEELDARQKTVAASLVEKFIDQGMGLTYQEKEQDKYRFEPVQINCAERVHLCKAACCRLTFALSKQDVEEGMVKWNFERPYLIARQSSGYCLHMDQQDFNCTIHDQRPVPCRGYDCRQDQRIWANFEEKRVSPDLERLLRTSDGVEIAVDRHTS